jgi:hypothetical protein
MLGSEQCSERTMVSPGAGAAEEGATGGGDMIGDGSGDGGSRLRVG